MKRCLRSLPRAANSMEALTGSLTISLRRHPQCWALSMPRWGSGGHCSCTGSSGLCCCSMAPTGWPSQARSLPPPVPVPLTRSAAHRPAYVQNASTTHTPPHQVSLAGANMTLLPLVLASDRFALSPAEVGMCFALQSLISVMGAAPSASLADRVGPGDGTADNQLIRPPQAQISALHRYARIHALY